MSSSELCLIVGQVGSSNTIALLSLPEMYDDWHIEEVHCSNNGPWSSRTGDYMPYKCPFLPADERGILVFCFVLRALRPATKNLTMVIGHDFLASLYELPASTEIIRWEDWGPANTRCFVDIHLSEDGFALSTHKHAHHNRLMTKMDIYDFNPLQLARDLCHGDSEGVESEPSIIPDYNELPEVKHTGLFIEPVVSSLPYRRIPHNIRVEPTNPFVLSRDLLLEEQLMMEHVDRPGGMSRMNVTIYH